MLLFFCYTNLWEDIIFWFEWLEICFLLEKCYTPIRGTVLNVPAKGELNICLPTCYSDIIRYHALYSANIITSAMWWANHWKWKIPGIEMVTLKRNHTLSCSAVKKIQFRTTPHHGANTYDEIPVRVFYMWTIRATLLKNKLAMTDERRFQFSLGSSKLYLSSAHQLTSFPPFLAQQRIDRHKIHCNHTIR